jgi:anti-sigma factor RsiW
MSDTQAITRRQFDELVPWYVTGELPAPERAQVERYLAQHPEANAELAWHRSMASAVDRHYSRLPESAGWSGLEQRLRADRIARAAAPRTWSERLFDWLGGAALRPASALAALAIVGQAAVIGMLVWNQQTAVPEHSIVRGAPSAAEKALQVRFRQSAAEQELRALLSSVGARIVDGPDQLGDYVLLPKAGSVQALHDALKQSELVVNLEWHEWKPAERGAAKP